MVLAARSFICFGCCVILIAVLALIATPESAPNSGDTADRLPQMQPAHSTDDAHLIVDAHLSPYAAVGRFTGTMVCTAALVLHPRIIITAAHCIAARDRKPRASKPFF